jgi:hypothetical protein
MLYTDAQLVSFADYCLKAGIQEPSHAARKNWEDINNIQPIQVGQPLHIDLVDGIKITATIDCIDKGEVE